MTLKYIIELLKKSGINSKHQVIKLLEELNEPEALELILSILIKSNFSKETYLGFKREINKTLDSLIKYQEESQRTI